MNDQFDKEIREDEPGRETREMEGTAEKATDETTAAKDMPEEKAEEEDMLEEERLDEEKGDDGSFEELLKEYGDGMDDSLTTGDKIEGTVVSIGQDAVYIDTGTKVDGAVDKAELLDDKGELPYAVGDKVTLYVVGVSEHEIRLSRALSGVGGLEMLQDAFHGKVPVEGKVMAVQKGGFHVEVLQRRAFCPISQMDVKYIESAGDYIGQTHEFLITQLEDHGKNIVLSRRKILEAKIAEARAEFFEGLSIGQTIEGVVTKIMPFGVFVEIAPGVEGMAHISELGWSRVETPEEAVSVHQKITVKVIGVENAANPDKAKISLSIKQVGSDPWESVDENFQIGQTVEGKVVRIAKFGAFVEIAPGIEGLVHISELSHTRRVPRVEDAVAEGESVRVSIKEIDPARRRVSLSIKDTEADPWKAAGSKFAVGAKLEGLVVKQESFGWFVELEPGITGLMPKSKIKSSGMSEIEKARVGDTVAATVIHFDPESRKITLEPRGGNEAEEEDWRKFGQPEEKPMSDLALKLQNALKSKK